MAGRSYLKAKYTDRLGEPAWRDAGEYEEALKASASALVAGTVKIQQGEGVGFPLPDGRWLVDECESLRHVYDAATMYLSEQGACSDSPDDGSSSLCEKPGCWYCALARAVENANG